MSIKIKYFLNKIIFFFFLFFNFVKNSKYNNQEYLVSEKENNFCENNWEYWPERHLCIKIFNEKIGWNVAEINCLYNQGHQISVKNIKENKYLENIARRVGGLIWLGAAQFGHLNNYMWTDGTPFYFTFWQNGIQPLFNPGKKCIKMNSLTGEWIQSCCRVAAPFVCQKPAFKINKLRNEERKEEFIQR
uniref:C-type lectin domain-containing protein n=1 Tax=Meloidogyne enterolobii TaxID=390850 RepID=A0A6V7WUR0_MELEN|nr:unnamed protein product [Meloidogyne enterolobii]